MKPSDFIDILEEWYRERKRHSDKSFKQWLKHVGGLWTSKEEWRKLGRWETWKPEVKNTGNKLKKLVLTQILTVIVIIIIANIFS